ncbi:hypothetical protein C7B65_02855 [Phormidesmis priestleyi ULC007]|uniref:Uncharacterized protein n=1 Tax=Phormidesmis priestleyi ULC007 TaxID=1920490 RepID=A0A2T1DM48_9CYAN|nr:hypothetical protein [Phormidesmis priestleyi]PSB21542.1 hypothetical protein C7B65_02855 [Phormidesmis priestleyi ULC007]PZO54582.1 MAG: hypothetical protein DCF14_01370 [Phormidesmis priestleyi]
MSEAVQYVTNQQGERVGVLLDLETYHRLSNISASDEDLLTGLSLEELQALADSQLASTEQVQLGELLIQNADGQLPPEANTKIDLLLTQVDNLNILKTRARYTLKQLYGVSI